MEPESFAFAFIMIGIGIIIGGAMGFYFENTDDIGQMVCDDKGLGDFVEFDEDSKTVKCEPRPVREQFDGGYVQVVHGGGQ